MEDHGRTLLSLACRFILYMRKMTNQHAGEVSTRCPYTVPHRNYSLTDVQLSTQRFSKDNRSWSVIRKFTFQHGRHNIGICGVKGDVTAEPLHSTINESTKEKCLVNPVITRACTLYFYFLGNDMHRLLAFPMLYSSPGFFVYYR